MLWLALECPRLALEAFAAPSTRTPLAVMEPRSGRRRIHACNPVAAAAGVRPGMSASTALSLCEGLCLRERDPAAEAERLQALATWAIQFTDHVSLQDRRGLLLEVAGSLRYFGGLVALRERLLAGLEDLGHRCRHAVAPTPGGAWVLARAGGEVAITDPATLQATLGALPPARLELDADTRRALEGMGIRSLAECLRLPRAELARRLGPALPADLDRLLGRRPDPRPPFEPPERFRSHLELPAEVENSRALVFAVRRLLVELGGFLRGRGAGIQGARLILHHRDAGDAVVALELVHPSRDPEHLQAILGERLERHALGAPVTGLTLEAERLVRLEARDRRLFGREGPAEDDTARLVERLRAHLGDDAVDTLRAVADHRPERAWSSVTAAPDRRIEWPAPRPTWLLETPRRLAERDGRPQLDGPLALVAGPERIESGWWDGDDVARDYFRARTPSGATAWVYRDLRSGTWFLQGWFA